MSLNRVPLALLVLLSVLVIAPLALFSGPNYWLSFVVPTCVIAVAVVKLLLQRVHSQFRAATTTLNAATAAWTRGDLDAAERLYLQLVAQAERIREHHDQNLGNALCHLGQFYRYTGRYAEAEPVLRQSLNHLAQVLPAHHPHRISVLNDLAVVSIQRGRYGEAEPLVLELSSLYGSEGTSEREEVPMMMHNLALIRKAQGRYDEAEALINEAGELLQKRPGDAFKGWLLENRADLRLRQGRLDVAETIAREALSTQEMTCGAESVTLARCLTTLAEIKRRRGQATEAEGLCRRCLGIVEKTFGENHPDLAGSLATLARLAADRGDHAVAEPLLRRCLAIQEQALVAEHPARVETRAAYAALLAKKSRTAEAEQGDACIKASDDSEARLS